MFVSNVLELVDVDNSTGDIDYNGDVSIKGNVLAGFTACHYNSLVHSLNSSV